MRLAVAEEPLALAAPRGPWVYENPWRPNPRTKPTPAAFTCPTPPRYHYRGFQVFHRGDWDYVLNGVCVTMRAGASKYKEVIDGLWAGTEYTWNPRVREVLAAAGARLSEEI